MAQDRNGEEQALEIHPEQQFSAAAGGALEQGHPPGLWVLFITEMWERFSYYGMRALLVLYLVAKVNSEFNPGLGWSKESAGTLYAWYTGLVYLMPLFGGWLADKLLGTHRSMLIGGWIIAAGHFCLAFTELSAPGSAAGLATFMTGLALIVVGTGFFKPCVSVMVGQLYAEDDPRRDSGFTIFYMGINVGAFLSGVVAGTLGEKVGWHWGFGSAGVGMVLGLIIYQIFRPKFLRGIGLPPGHPESRNADEGKREDGVAATERPLTKVDWDRIWVIVILALAVIFFWAAFEQAGSSMNIFAKDKTDRDVAGWEFPATWYQSVNPLYIVIFAPVFAWLWVWLERRQIHPRTPFKFAFGIMLLAVGFIFMVLASLASEAVPIWRATIDSGGETRTVYVHAVTGDVSAMHPLRDEQKAEETETEQEQDALAAYVSDKLSVDEDGKEIDEEERPLREIKAQRDGNTITWSAEAKIGSAWVPIKGTIDAAAAARTNLDKAAAEGDKQQIKDLNITPGETGLRVTAQVLVKYADGKIQHEVPLEGDAFWAAVHLKEMSDAAGLLTGYEKLSDLKLLAEPGVASFSGTLKVKVKGEETTVQVRGAVADGELIESDVGRIYANLAALDYLTDTQVVLTDGRVHYKAKVKDGEKLVDVTGDAIQTYVLDRVDSRTNAAEAVDVIEKKYSAAQIVKMELTVDRSNKAGPHWLLLAYLFHTWGELCLSPVGLSMVTKLAAPKIRSSMMGIWFGANFLANLTAGYLFAYSQQIAESKYFAWFVGEADFYLALVVVPFAVGVLVLLISPWLCKKMRGLH